MIKNTIKSNINNPNFKAIIFDLNGTIAARVSDHPEHIAYRNRYIENLTKEPVTENLPMLTSAALKIYDLDPQKYYLYRNSRIDWNIFNSFNSNTFDVLTQYYNWGYDLVLYTDCYTVQIEETLKILNLKDFFKLIISAEAGFKKPSSNAFKYISKKLNISVTDLLMIANDWTQDLEPLHRLNGNTVWIKSEKYLSNTQKIIADCQHQYMVPN